MHKAIGLAAAVEKIPDGASLMIGGFMGVGSPHRLIGELVREIVERFPQPVPFAFENRFGERQLRSRFAHLPVVLEAFVDALGGRHRFFAVHALAIVLLLLRLVHEVHDPGPDGLGHDLRALTLEELEHVEIAITLGRLSPELTSDLTSGLTRVRRL
jgi:hypothetical protein